MNQNLFFLWIILFLSTNCVDGQIESIHFGAGTSLAARILMLESDFTEEEKQSVRDLEILRLSYDLDIGLTTRLDERNFIEKGVMLKQMRFGSRKYIKPDSVINVTPQFGKLKQTVIQNQISIYFKYLFKPLKWNGNPSIFFRGDLVSNFKNYIIHEVTFDEDNNRGFVSRAGFDKFHSFDVRLVVGSNTKLWSKNKQGIFLECYIGGYLRPYDVYGTTPREGYLPFKKNTNGLVWEFGSKIIYHFDFNKKTKTSFDID